MSHQLSGSQGGWASRVRQPLESADTNTHSPEMSILWGFGGKQGCHRYPAAAAAKSLQSCATLCDPIDSSPPGSPIPGILQARTLEWVAIAFSNAWKWKWSPSVVSDSSRSRGLQPTRLLCPWDFPGKNNGVGYHCLTFTCFFSLQIIDKLL